MKNYIDFFHDLFEKEYPVPDIYKKIVHTENEDVLYEVDFDNKYTPSDLYCLEFVPNYMRLSLKNSSLYHVNSVVGDRGFSINLKNNENIDDYLVSQFKSKSRGAIRKYVKRLESSFDIDYKMYFGNIEDSEYDFLMTALRNMLNRRFEQRNGTDIFKRNWKKQCNLILKQIREKKASLFVIYKGKEPIAMSANYHFNEKVFFYWMPSYNIDYSTFRLGHILIYKELEWCFENKYSVYDMGRGALDYKEKWCNHICSFDYHYVYRKKSLRAFLLFKKEYFKLSFINYLKKKKVNVLVYKLKIFLKGKGSSERDENLSSYSIKDINTLEAFKDCIKINFTENKYIKIRKPINDFLFINVDHISNIEVLEILKEKKYLIKGKSKIRMITFE